MPDPSTYDQLCTYARETALLCSVASVLEWEEQTYMPPAAGAYRAEQLSLLAAMAHDRATAPQVGEWLAALADGPLASDPHSDTGAVIREMSRTYDRKTKLPRELVAAITRASSLGQQAWVEARKENAYAKFAPHLDEIMRLKREEADAVGYTDCRYDALLDEYEPHATSAAVGPVLDALARQLVPLVEKIAGSSHQPDTRFLAGPFAVVKQIPFGEKVAAALGFDFKQGRIDATAHPFCATLGPHDVRLTTRYQENEFSGWLFSVLHEAGHGLYEQGLPADQYGLPTGAAVSLGIHESQSRMWENQVARDRAFWEHFYVPLQQVFPDVLGSVALDDFHFAVNQVKPSLIRVEADEATYNLHILIRFQLERQLIDEGLSVDDLPTAWNQKYQQYLGITPPTDAMGVMQDVHWSAGLVGYFPTYALGNLYAAQFYEQVVADLGDPAAHFRRGEFAPLLDWLRSNIHQHGQRYSASQLVERVTGRPLASEALMRHLQGKFGELYRL
jgi:carboxypeptidase Taq